MSSRIEYQIEVSGDAMILLDDDGNSYDCHPLAGDRRAKAQIVEWSRHHPMNVAEMYLRLAEAFIGGDDL